MVSYKKSEGFQCSLQHSSEVVYDFRYRIATSRFKARYPELKLDEDPYAELSSDAEVSSSVEVPFDDCPTSPPALPLPA